jgi:hypothetical protein
LILDEYDKYIEELTPAIEKTRPFIKTLIMVSHTAPNHAERTLRQFFAHGRELFFHKHPDKGSFTVQVTEQILW